MIRLKHALIVAVLCTSTLVAADEKTAVLAKPEEGEIVHPDKFIQSLIADFRKAEGLKQDLRLLREARDADKKFQSRLEETLSKIESDDNASKRTEKLSLLRKQTEKLNESLKKKSEIIERLTSDLQEVARKRREFENEVRENPTRSNLEMRAALLEAEIDYLKDRNQALEKKNEALARQIKSLKLIKAQHDIEKAASKSKLKPRVKFKLPQE